ncbi:MAG: glycoside hydrolase family 130 protein [Egibacteraceae bacterium]
MRSTVPALRTAHELLPDPARVVARPYIPAGEITADAEPRTARLVRRVLSLSPEEVATRLAAVLRDFGGRHRDLEQILSANYKRVAHNVGNGAALTHAQQLLIGAYVTHEYTLEAAALFNPSMVPAPGPLGNGDQPFVMSVRSVGEGHLSSIEFRTGTARAGGGVAFDPAGKFASTGEIGSTEYNREMFEAKLDELGADCSLVHRLIDPLEERFTYPQLEERITAMAGEDVTPAASYKTVELARMLACANYVVSFDPQMPLSERVIFPVGPTESHGMEDARFVRFTGEDGAVTYFATYTAFDGSNILPQLIETVDFTTFRISTLNGSCARNKGMALFPRKIGGQFVALSRYDQENIDLMFSARVHFWHARQRLRRPEHAWEFIQIGNCGSPLETEAGWLVLTHGVGPMRTYAIGALLLDLDDPQRVIGELPAPLLAPDERERNGYVPNVLYSCGGMVHDGSLLLPYGFSDAGIRIAVVELPALLDYMAG